MALYTNGHSAGTNSDTGDFLIPDEGIMLSSGEPHDFNGNDSDETTYSFSRFPTNDPDISSLVPGAEVYDSCYLEFEFRCPPETALYTPVVSFDYVFGSEEYYEYVFSEYNDAFGFFLNGENIALVPQTTNTGVAINNVNNEVHSNQFVGNENVNGNAMTSPYPLIEADGLTSEMTATANPNEGWNRIKVVIADIADPILDSWVLLEANTFSCLLRTEAPSISSTDEVNMPKCLVTY